MYYDVVYLYTYVLVRLYVVCSVDTVGING